eukprot:COSAG06_NODE_1393_length_9596_cov_47.877014_4_plen_68_part_00
MGIARDWTKPIESRYVLAFKLPHLLPGQTPIKPVFGAGVRVARVALEGKRAPRVVDPRALSRKLIKC